MNKRLSYRPLFIILLSLNGMLSAYAQKKFNFTISFTGSGLNYKNLTVNFYEGYNASSIPVAPLHKIVSSGTSKLKYPVLEIFYNPPKQKPIVYRFFLVKVVSSILLNYEIDKDELIIAQSTGVINFKEAGQKKFEAFAEKEFSLLEAFEKKYNYDYSNLDSTSYNQLRTLTVALRNKGIDFIKINPKSLYSLWFFMNELLDPRNYSFEYLNTMYRKYLQPNFKNTFEDKKILENLNKNRLAIMTTAPFQDVSFTDVKGNKHRIKDFRGRPLIIMIWATWCVPCIEELPALKGLYLKFENRLGLISFSLDNNEKHHKSFIIKNDMDWINVYGRYDFCKVYGADKGVPQVYLIDKNGSIVYSRSILKDNELKKLPAIVEQILADVTSGKNISN